MCIPGFQDGRVKLFQGDRVSDLLHTDDIALLSDNAQAIQRAFDHLAVKVPGHALCSAP